MTCSIVTVDRQLTAVVRAKVSFPDIPKAQRSAVEVARDIEAAVKVICDEEALDRDST